MATTTTEVVQERPSTVKLVGGHDFKTLIGYTRPPVDGSEPSMDDLASDHPTYREVRYAKVYDARGIEDQFRLQEHGFQYYKLPSIPGDGIVEFTNELDSKIMSLYYAGMSEWFAKQ